VIVARGSIFPPVHDFLNRGNRSPVFVWQAFALARAALPPGHLLLFVFSLAIYRSSWFLRHTGRFESPASSQPSKRPSTDLEYQMMLYPLSLSFLEIWLRDWRFANIQYAVN